VLCLKTFIRNDEQVRGNPITSHRHPQPSSLQSYRRLDQQCSAMRNTSHSNPVLDNSPFSSCRGECYKTCTRVWVWVWVCPLHGHYRQCCNLPHQPSNSPFSSQDSKEQVQGLYQSTSAVGW